MSSFDSKELENHMQKSIDLYHKELSGLRTGRASPAMLEFLNVDAYGSQMPLSQVASISVIEARTLSIQVWDAALVSAVEKTIINSSLGISPNTEGQVIRIQLPEMSEERRIEIAKMAGKYAEKCRVAVRQIRRDAIDNIKKQEKNGDISQDQLHNLSEKIQKITDQYISTIDESLEKKKIDITSI